MLKLERDPSAPDVVRYTSGFGFMIASSGMAPIAPPWSSLTAYDLNQGTIMWKLPLGDVPELAAKGIHNTGSHYPKVGPVVTATGLIFTGTRDKEIRALDVNDGKVLWEKELDANPEGIPAVYEAGGREYIAFCTRAGRVFDNIGTESIAWSPGKPEAAGYYVFALPKLKGETK